MQRRSLFFRTTLATALLLSTASPVIAGGVRIVEPTGTQNFASIQAAVNAAPDGAVLLVGSGTYSGFSLSGKSLSIFGAPGGTISVQGTVNVSADAGQTVVISGLNVQPPNESGSTALIATGSGFLRFQDCTFHGADYVDWILCEISGPGSAGPTGAVVSDCSRIAFSSCTLFGGHGQNNEDEPEYCDFTRWGGGRGGTGLEATASKVVLYDCQVYGNGGGESLGYGGSGGVGAELNGTSLFASASQIYGASGGMNWGGSPCSGPGAPGCHVVNGSSIAAVGCSFDGGCGGGFPPSCSTTCVEAPPVAGGAATVLPGPARIATITPRVRGDARTWAIAFHNAADDRVYLPIATRPDFVPTARGAWLEPFRDLESTRFLGTSNASGNLSTSAPTPDLVPGPLDPICELRYAQIASRAPSSNLLPGREHAYPWYDALGSAGVLLLIDRDSLPDCNGNGVNDFVEVVEGTTPDANRNLIPDGCPGG
jgi:hypothetical protein